MLWNQTTVDMLYCFESLQQIDSKESFVWESDCIGCTARFWFTSKNRIIGVIQYCDCAPLSSKLRNIILVQFSVHIDRKMQVQGTLTEPNFIWLHYIKSIPNPPHHLKVISWSRSAVQSTQSYSRKASRSQLL